MSRMKRLVASFLLAFFTYTSVVLPAHAFGFLLAPIVPWLVTSEGVASVASVAVHAAIFSIVFKDDSSTPANANDGKLTVMLATKAELPNRPSGSGFSNYSGPVYPAYQPVPPSSVTGGISSIFTVSGLGGNSTSALLACQNTVTTWCIGDGSCSSIAATNVTSSTFGCSGTASNGSHTTSSGSISNTCPSGYSVSGSNCNLSNAAIVQKPSDGKRTVARSSNTAFTADPLDTADSLPAEVTVSAGDFQMLDQYGTVVNVHLNSDGTGYIIQNKPNSDGATSTKTTINLGAPNPSGTDAAGSAPLVTGVKVEQVQGIGTGTSGSIALSSPLDISNLATHTDVAAVGTKVDTMADTLHHDLTDHIPSTPDNGFTDEKTAITDAYDNEAGVIAAIGASPQANHGFTYDWNPLDDMPTDTSCDNSWFHSSIAGHEVDMDLCTPISKVREILGWFLGIATAFVLFEILVQPRGS